MEGEFLRFPTIIPATTVFTSDLSDGRLFIAECPAKALLICIRAVDSAGPFMHFAIACFRSCCDNIVNIALRGEQDGL
jgi:hypothetical protein